MRTASRDSRRRCLPWGLARFGPMADIGIGLHGMKSPRQIEQQVGYSWSFCTPIMNSEVRNPFGGSVICVPPGGKIPPPLLETYHYQKITGERVTICKHDKIPSPLRGERVKGEGWLRQLTPPSPQERGKREKDRTLHKKILVGEGEPLEKGEKTAGCFKDPFIKGGFIPKLRSYR